MLFSSIGYSILLIKKYKNLKKLQLFIWLLLFSTIETIFNFTFSELLKKPEIFLNITEYTQKIYLGFEIFVIVIYYKQIEFNVNKKTFLKTEILYGCYVLVSLAFISGIFFKNLALIITIAELIIIDFFFVKLVLLEILYDQRIKYKYQKILNQGIFIFINLIAPYSIINELIYQSNLPIYLSLNFINDIGYILLFSALFKSSKCYQ